MDNNCTFFNYHDWQKVDFGVGGCILCLFIWRAGYILLSRVDEPSYSHTFLILLWAYLYLRMVCNFTGKIRMVYYATIVGAHRQQPTVVHLLVLECWSKMEDRQPRNRQEMQERCLAMYQLTIYVYYPLGWEDDDVGVGLLLLVNIIVLYIRDEKEKHRY